MGGDQAEIGERGINLSMETRGIVRTGRLMPPSVASHDSNA